MYRASRCRRNPRGAAILAALLAAGASATPAALLARPLDPLRLTPEMRAWAHQQAPPGLDPELRMERLLDTLLGPAEDALRYDASFNGTAEEVFAAGRYNCLSLAHLLVALGREVGVATYYLREAAPRSFRKEGDLVLVTEHVTVGWGETGARWELRLQGQPLALRLDRISDATALALHYSNLGTDGLRAGRPQQARERLEAAVATDGELAGAWVNLGVARRRLGDADGAEAAYLRATEADPAHATAYVNLFALLRARGRPDAARELIDLLDRRGNRNPFVFLMLGDAARDDGRLQEARRLYRRARHRGPRHPEVLAALGELALAEQRERAA
ncbi:MAG TPA: tetratricopeptide repeat protein, partial [Thermoanaerobaculia bacterium]|nr:tetratricopeptide repeat protein [Thermoanaerobaculia bacterium]